MLKPRFLFVFTLVLLTFINCSNIAVVKDQTICLQPFTGFSKSHLKEVKQAIEKYYGFEVVILDEIELPDNAYTTIRKPRYRADTIIKYIKSIKPVEYDYIIGLTNKDISITKYTGTGANKKIKEPSWKYCDFGIFGLGYRPGPSCLIHSFACIIWYLTSPLSLAARLPSGSCFSCPS